MKSTKARNIIAAYSGRSSVAGGSRGKMTVHYPNRKTRRARWGEMFGKGKKRKASAYDGTIQNRQTADWVVGDVDPIDLITSHLTILRQRSRDLARKATPFIGAVEAIVDMVVKPDDGVRIQPKARKSRTSDELNDPLIRELKSIWEEAQTQADISSRESFGQFCRLSVREWVEAGEAFIFESIDADDPERELPIYWKIIPAERVPHDLNRPRGNGKNKIVNGIEFDARDRRVAYWVDRVDETGKIVTAIGDDERGRERIPASKIRHVFRKLRAGQERGLPWVFGATLLCHDLDDLIDDELTSAHVATMLTAWIKRNNAGVFGPEEEASRDEDTDRPRFEFEAGAVFDLKPNEDVGTIDPNRPGNQFVPFAKFILQCIAKTFGISYERMTGDYSQVNFASGRLGHIAERETVRRIQGDLIQLFVRPAWRSIVKTAIAAGKVVTVTLIDYLKSPRLYDRARFIAKGFEHHDELKSATAAGLRMGLGIKTLQDECDDVNLDWEDNLTQRAKELDRMRDLGIPIVTVGGSQSIAGQGDGSANATEETDRQREDRESRDGMSLADLRERGLHFVTMNGNGKHR